METRKSKKTKREQIVPQKVKRPKNTYLFSTSNNVLPSVITPFLSIEDRTNLSTTCSNLYTIFKPNLESLAFTRLLQATVDDERKVVKNILDRRPALLRKVKLQVIESKKTWQRFLIGNPFQIATARRQLEMVKLQLPYFQLLEERGEINDGKVEALALWKNRKASAQEQARYAHKIKQLLDVIAAETFPEENDSDIEEKIDARRFNEVEFSENTTKQLENFRKEMLPDEAITLENDNYFDLEQFLIAAYDAYITHFEVFQNWNQRYFFSICIIGFLQSVLPPEVFCQGLYNFVKDKKLAIPRVYEGLRFVDESILYRQSRDSRSRVGFDFVVGGAVGWYGEDVNLLAKNYVVHKQLNLDEMMSELKLGHWPEEVKAWSFKKM